MVFYSYCDKLICWWSASLVDWTGIALATANIQTNDLAFICAALPCGHSRLAWSHINTEHLNFQHTRQNSRALNWFYRIDCKKRKIIHLNYSATQTKSEPQCMYTRTLRASGVCILLSALVYTKQERLGRQVQRNRRLKKKEKSIPSLTPLPRVVFICAPGVGNLTWMALAAR
jgi:hypothetical protein